MAKAKPQHDQAESKITKDQDTIKKWTEDRQGKPAMVASTKKGGSGMLRIKFQDEQQNLQEVPWEQFFKVFEENELSFLYQEKTKEGQLSRFFKFVREREKEE